MHGKIQSIIIVLIIFLAACQSTRDVVLDDSDQQGQGIEENTPLSFEARARTLYGEERYVEALRFHLLAASSAMDTQVQEYHAISARNIIEAERILQEMRIERVQAPTSGKVQISFEDEVMLAVMRRNQALENIPLTIHQQYQLPNGKNLNRTSIMYSDEEGMVSFIPEIPVSTDPYIISVSVDFIMLVGNEVNGIPIINEIKVLVEEAFAQLTERIVIPIDSDAQAYSIVVMVTDIDVAGSIIQESNTAEGIITTLREENFTVESFSSSVSFDRKSALEVARNAYGDRVDRVLFGSTTIVQFEDHQAGYAVAVRSQIEVLDLRTGDTLLVVDKNQRSNGRNSSSTVINSFRIVGTRVAEEVIRGLP